MAEWLQDQGRVLRIMAGADELEQRLYLCQEKGHGHLRQYLVGSPMET